MKCTLTHCTLLIVLTGLFCTPAGAGDAPMVMEVFTAAQFPVVSTTSPATVYVLDGIARLQQDLSRDLPKDPTQAKALVMTRLQRLDSHASAELENAATGLLRAHEYGLDRYPAIVFDGQAIVYGVIDLDVARGHYQQWWGRAER